jgi:hypothetical protein
MKTKEFIPTSLALNALRMETLIPIMFVMKVNGAPFTLIAMNVK